MSRLAPLLPLVPLILLAGWPFLGAALPWAALLWMAGLIPLADRLAGRGEPGPGPGMLAALLPVIAASGSLVVLAVATWRVATGPAGATAVAGFLATGLTLGTVGISSAHELIHRPDRLRRALGTWLFRAIGFGHHASAHPAVHHRFVATPDDPNSAPRGMGFYRFALRAWRGSFVAGFRAEARRLAARGLPPLHAANPYWGHVAGAALAAGVAWALAGWVGVAVWAGLSAHAQTLLLLADYVQHYGLRRARLADGRHEPVAPRHSWVAPQRFSAAMTLKAGYHADHHAHPSRDWAALRLMDEAGAPVLPRGLPVMSMLALWPALWRRVMHPRLDRLAQRDGREAAHADLAGQNPAGPL